MSLTATASGKLATLQSGYPTSGSDFGQSRQPIAVSSVQNRGHAKHAGGRLNYALATCNARLPSPLAAPENFLPGNDDQPSEPTLIHRAAILSIFSTFSQVAMLPPIILCFINDSAAKNIAHICRLDTAATCSGISNASASATATAATNRSQHFPLSFWPKAVCRLSLSHHETLDFNPF